MSIEIPPALQWISYLAGSKWPQGDEDGLWRIGEHWHASASEMSDLIPDLTRVRNETMSVITGETATTAEQEFAKLFDGDYSVDKLVEAMSALGETARQAGTQVEASKIEILVGLGMAAAEVLYAIAMAPWTFGASMAWIPAIEAITMAAIRMLFNQLMRALVRRAVEALTKTAVSRLVREVAKETAEEVAEELITNLAIQQYQIDKGHKDKIDWGDVGDAAKGAAAGGAAAGAFHGPAFGALGGKHGNGGIGNAFAGAGASYGAEVVAGVAGSLAVGGNLDAGEIFAGGALGGVSGGIESSHGHGHDGPGHDGDGEDAPHGTPAGLDGGKSHAFDSDDKGPEGKEPDGKDVGGKDSGGKGSDEAGSPDAAPPYAKSDPNGSPPPFDQHQSNDGPSDAPEGSVSENSHDSDTAATGAPPPQTHDGSPAPQGGGQNGQSGSPQTQDGAHPGGAATQHDSSGSQNGDTSSQQNPGEGNTQGGAQQSPGDGQTGNTTTQHESSNNPNGEPNSDQTPRGDTANTATQHEPSSDQNSGSSPQQTPSGSSSEGAPAHQLDGQHSPSGAQESATHGHDSQSTPPESPPQHSSSQPTPQSDSPPAQHDSQPGQNSGRRPEPAPHQTSTPSDTPPTRAETPPPVSQSPNGAPPESPVPNHSSSAGRPFDDAPASQDDAHQVGGPTPSDHPSHVGTAPSNTNDTASQPAPSSTDSDTNTSPPPSNSPSTPPPASNPSTAATPPTATPSTQTTGPTSTTGTQSAAQPGSPNASATPTAPNNQSASSPSTTATHASNSPGTSAKPVSAGLGTSSNSAPTAVSNVANSTASTTASRSTAEDQPQVVVGMVPGHTPPPADKPARPKVTSGGPPPKLPPPKHDSGVDVSSDETWRHDPATTADWFEPSDPTPRADIDAHRDDTYVQTVDTEVANVLADSTPTHMPTPHTSLIRYDLRRIEVAPNKFVQEYTVKLSVSADPDPALGPDAVVDTVADVQAKAKAGVDRLLNKGNRLPSGDEFRVKVEFTDTGAHAAVRVGNFAENTQTTWRPDASENVLAHEILHYLGVPDEGRDSRIALRRHDQNSGVHDQDGGMMTSDVLGRDPRLRPRHLWMVERTANSQVSVPMSLLTSADNARTPLPPKVFDVGDQPSETSRAPKHAPKRDRSSPPRDAPPAKRARVDDSDPPAHSDDADIEMADDTRDHHDQTDSDAQPNPDTVADQLGRLDLGPDTKTNSKFDELLQHPPGRDLTKGTYFQHLQDSVNHDHPISFVVNATVSHQHLAQLADVVKSITDGAKGLDGKIAVVVGVNAPPSARAELEAALEDAKTQLEGLDHPVALVGTPVHVTKSLPYGTWRNETLDSEAHRRAVQAMAAKGTHPYVSIQDFDTGSRTIEGGEHIFNHVINSLQVEGGPAAKPLAFSGGYRASADILNTTRQRLTNEKEQHRHDLDQFNRSLSAEERAAIDKALAEEKTAASKKGKETTAGKKRKNTPLEKKIKKKKALVDRQALLEKGEKRLSEADFVADFTRAVDQDMATRDRLAKLAPLLPYSPEPNLFIDAIPLLVDNKVRFSDAGAEADGLNTALAAFHANELRSMYPTPSYPSNADTTLASPVTETTAKDNSASDLHVDASTGRHGLRGQSFVADFHGAAIETDLSRLANGYAKTGKVPQTHATLTNVVGRLHDNETKSDKAGLSLAGVRDDLPKVSAPGRAAVDSVLFKPEDDPARAALPKGVTTTPKTAGLDRPLNPKLSTAVTHATDPDDPDGDPRDIYTGIDQGDLRQIITATLGVALSGPDATLQHHFQQLHAVAADERSGGTAKNGLYAAVAAQLDTDHRSADKLRDDTIKFVAQLDPKPKANKAIGAELADFDSEHRAAPGDLVNAVLQPGPSPLTKAQKVQQPRDAQKYYGQRGDDGEFGSSNEKQYETGNFGPTPDPVNSIRNAEAIAIKALATHLGRPIEVQYPGEPPVTHTPAGVKNSSNDSVRVHATPLPNGRSTFAANPPSSLRGPVSGLPDAGSPAEDRPGPGQWGGSAAVTPRAELPRSTQSHRDVAKWVGDVNNDGDPSVSPAGDRLTNCGPTTWTVFDRLSSTPSFGRAHPAQLRAEDVGEVTGLSLRASDPDAIADGLRDAGVGAHTVVVTKFGNGVAHSFNAMFDGDGVWAIDGQHGTLTAWPPSLGREGNPVTGWFAGTPASHSNVGDPAGEGAGAVHGLTSQPSTSDHAAATESDSESGDTATIQPGATPATGGTGLQPDADAELQRDGNPNTHPDGRPERGPLTDDERTASDTETGAQKQEREAREQDVFGEFEKLPVVPVKFKEGQPLGGSSGVHLHEVDGRKVAIKPSRGMRAVKTELLAQALFRATGAPTVRATPVLVEGEGSQIHLMSDFLHGKMPDESVHAQFAGHPDVARFAAADMLLSNWDSHKTDAYIAAGRRVVRIDVGGSLDLRAQGGIREGWMAVDLARGGFDVDEIKSGSRMRSKGPFMNLTDEQVADSIRTVADRLTPDAIDAAIRESGYPRAEGAELKAVLRARIAKALEWADGVYPPALKMKNESFRRVLTDDLRSDTAARAMPEKDEETERFVDDSPVVDSLGPQVSDGNSMPPRSTEDDGDSRTALQQLVEDFGYDPTPTGELSLLSEIADSRSTNTDTRVEHFDSTINVEIRSVQDARVADALGPPSYVFEQRADATVPAVGPEELFRASQHGDDHARARFAEHSGMLDGGVLIRRMSEAEVNAFQTALASDDLNTIQKALFGVGASNSTPATGPKRGEIVWSLNDTFKFTRELTPDTATTGSNATHHDADNYKKVLEIPVTEEMARLLAQNLYISNPVDGAKPAAFQGNPNLKYEGTAGGANNSTGVPNVVIKRNGFAGFWSTVHEVRVFDAAAHVSAKKYAPAPTIKSKEDRAKRESEKPDAKNKSTARGAAKLLPSLIDDDDFDLFGGMLDDDPPHTPAATPSSGSAQARPAPETAPELPLTDETPTAKGPGQGQGQPEYSMATTELQVPSTPTPPRTRPAPQSPPPRGGFRHDEGTGRATAAPTESGSESDDDDQFFDALEDLEPSGDAIAVTQASSGNTTAVRGAAHPDSESESDDDDEFVDALDQLGQADQNSSTVQSSTEYSFVEQDAPRTAAAQPLTPPDLRQQDPVISEDQEQERDPGPRPDKGKGRATAEELARHEQEEQQVQPDAVSGNLDDASAESQPPAVEAEARETARQGGVNLAVPQPDTPPEPPAVGHSTLRAATKTNSDADADVIPHTPAEQVLDEQATKTVPTAAESHLDPEPSPRLPGRDGANLVLGGMDIVESFHSGNGSLNQIREVVTQHGDQKAWDAHRERLTALFSDDGLRPKVAGMLRGGKPVSSVVELGSGRTLSIDLRLDPAASSLEFKETVKDYEFEHSSDPSSVTGSFDEGRRTYVVGAQASLTHANASHTAGVFGVREHQWSESRQRTDRQISGGQTVEPGTRFKGDIHAVVSYRVSGPVTGNTGVPVTLSPVTFHTEVAVPTRAVTGAADPAAASDAPPRVANSRSLTGSDVVTNLQLMPDDDRDHGPRPTTDFVSSPGMRTAFESAYGKDAGRAMNEIDDWLSVELLQANLHGMTNKQPLVHHFEGIGGRVEVHAFVESLGTPSDNKPAFGEQTLNSADPQMRATGETSKTEFHYGTETDSTQAWQNQTTYTAQLPLPGRSRGQGGTPTGEVVGGLDGGLNVGRSTNEVTSSQFRNRSTLKNPVAGQAWNGQVRLRFVMHAPDSVSPTQRNGAFKGAVHETRAEFDVLIEKSETTPIADYQGKEVHAPPSRIWGRGGPPADRNSSTPRSRWTLSRGPRPVVATDDSSAARERGEAEKLTGLGSMDRVTNLDLSGFHGLLDSMGHRAFGSKWNQVRPTVTAASHLNRIRSGLPGMTQHSPLTTAELSGPGSSTALALTADIENLTYRRTIDKVLSSPSMENTEGATTTTISTKQISGQAALGGRGGDVAGGPVLGEVIAGATQTVREGDRVREQQRMVVATKFEQPMAIFDGWVRIDGTMTGSKATVHESGLFPIEIAIPLSQLQGSRTHDDVLPPTFDRSNPAGFVAAPRATPESSLAATTPAAAQRAPLANAADIAEKRQQISNEYNTNKPDLVPKPPWWDFKSPAKPGPTRPLNPDPRARLNDIVDRAADADPVDGGSHRRAPEQAPLTWTPPVTTTEPPTPPAHALQETWQPTDMLVGLDPASGLMEAIRADLGPALGRDIDKAMAGLSQEFGPQVLQSRLAHQSGQQWSHDVSVPAGRITVKVRVIREASAKYVGQSNKFETDLSIESQSSTARLHDDLTRHVEGGRLVVPFPHGSASVQVTHGGSILPKDAPSASGGTSDLTTPRAETTVTDTEHRTPTRVKTTEAHDLFRQPIRFEISYERHNVARLLPNVPENPADVRLEGVFSYPHVAPAEHALAAEPAAGSDIRLDPHQVVSEVRLPAKPPASHAPASTPAPTEDATAAHVLGSMDEQGRDVFGDDWPAVRAELAQHVGTRALLGGLGDYSRNGEKTIDLRSVRGGKVVLSARVNAISDPIPGTAKEAEFYTGGQTIQTATDTNTKTDNWNVTVQAQGTVMPVDVGVNASLLGRVDVNRATDSGNTRTDTSATGELGRKKAAAHVRAGTATVRASMSRPTGLLGNGPRLERDGLAQIEFRTRQPSPDVDQDRYDPRPEGGLPPGSMVRKVLDGDRFRQQTLDNLQAPLSGIAASRLRDRLPGALGDVKLQHNLPAMTRGEEVELFRDGPLRVTGRANLTGLDFTGVERVGGMTNLLNEVNQGSSHQDSSAWEGGARVMAGPHGNLGDVVRGSVMAGGGVLGRSRHGVTYGQSAKVSANAKFAGAHAVFDGEAEIVLTVHDGDTPHTLTGVVVHGPMLIPTSQAELVETPSASAVFVPDRLADRSDGAGLTTSTTGRPDEPAGLPITRTSRLRRLFGTSRGNLPDRPATPQDGPKTPST